MNGQQRTILEEMNAFAENFPAIKALYLFGSIARGDDVATSDIDIAVDWVDDVQTNQEMIVSYCQFQPAGLIWGDALAAVMLKPVCFIRHNIDTLDDPAWPAIQEGARNPLARVGKAIMVWTPLKP